MPSLASEIRRSPFSRIYSFRDLVGLRTLGELRDRCGFSLQRLRPVGEWLSRHFDVPWSSLRFYVDGEHIAFRDPSSGTLVSTEPPGQAAIPFILEAVAQQTAIEAHKLAQRRPDEIGRITRHRYVLSNTPVFAGTRIPTAAVWDFHRAGYDADSIIREYPRLTKRDVEQAIRFEKERCQHQRVS